MAAMSLLFFLIILVTFNDVIGGQKRKTDNGKPFIISTIYSIPYVGRAHTPRNSSKPLVGNARFKGFIPDMLSHIQRRSNFEYILKVVKDGNYGSPSISNNSLVWNGGVAEVMRAEADIMAADLTITYLRERVVDFTVPFTSVRLKVLLRKRRNDRSPQLPTTLAQLLDNNYRIVVIRGSSTASFFRQSFIPLYQRVSKSMRLVRSTFEAIRAVRASWDAKYAFITLGSTVDSITSDFRFCDMTSLPEEYGQTRFYGMAVRQGNTELREKLNRALLHLEESGVMEMLRNKWWYRHCR